MHDSTLNLRLKRKSNLVIMTSINLLLLSFFVALAALSLPDSRKARFGINSLIEGFRLKPAKVSSLDEIGGKDAAIANMRRLVAEAGLIKGTGVFESSLGMTVAIKSDILFEENSADLEPGAIKSLAALASIVKGLNNDIIITGFTDSRPVEVPPFNSNWALSAARAMSVMSCFVDNGISSKKIRVYGLGPEHPVSSNSSDAGRSINSRVEITLAGKLPAGVSEKVQGIGQEKTGTPPVYRYKGYDIPFEEK